jgi:hypothetical protein
VLWYHLTSADLLHVNMQDESFITFQSPFAVGFSKMKTDVTQPECRYALRSERAIHYTMHKGHCKYHKVDIINKPYHNSIT